MEVCLTASLAREVCASTHVFIRDFGEIVALSGYSVSVKTLKNFYTFSLKNVS